MKSRFVVMCSFGILVLCGAVVGLNAQNGGVSGEAVYKERCAYCHGAEGKGDGPPNTMLSVPARDFTTGVYKIRSTESGSIPTDGDLVRSISQGLPGTSMPAFKGIISDDEIAAVTTYIKSLSPRFAREKPKAVPVPRRTSYPESGVQKGKKVFEKLECAGCHGTDGAGRNALVTEFVDHRGRVTAAANLKEPWSFRGGSSVSDIYLRLRTGLDGTQMASYAGAVSDQELYDLAQYVSSLRRKPTWEMAADELEAHYSSLAEKTKSDPVSWGRYLVATYGCGDCHSALAPDGSVMDGYYLAGGQRWTLEPFFTSLYPGNLTSDKETGLGRYTDDQIRDALTKGIRPSDGSRMLPFPMPWPNLAGMKPEDIDAIIAYLRTVPPVSNAIPEREEPNIVSYLWMKFQALILKKPFPSYIHPGNAGTAQGESMSSVFESGEEVAK